MAIGNSNDCTKKGGKTFRPTYQHSFCRKRRFTNDAPKGQSDLKVAPTARLEVFRWVLRGRRPRKTHRNTQKGPQAGQYEGEKRLLNRPAKRKRVLDICSHPWYSFSHSK